MTKNGNDSNWEAKCMSSNEYCGVLLDKLEVREDEIGRLKEEVIALKNSISKVTQILEKYK